MKKLFDAKKLKSGSTVWVELADLPVADGLDGKALQTKMVVTPMHEHSVAVVERFVAKNGGKLLALDGKDKVYADKFGQAVYAYTQEQRRLAGQELLPEYQELRLQAKVGPTR